MTCPIIFLDNFENKKHIMSNLQPKSMTYMPEWACYRIDYYKPYMEVLIEENGQVKAAHFDYENMDLVFSEHILRSRAKNLSDLMINNTRVLGGYLHFIPPEGRSRLRYDNFANFFVQTLQATYNPWLEKYIIDIAISERPPPPRRLSSLNVK